MGKKAPDGAIKTLAKRAPNIAEGARGEGHARRMRQHASILSEAGTSQFFYFYVPVEFSGRPFA